MNVWWPCRILLNLPPAKWTGMHVCILCLISNTLGVCISVCDVLNTLGICGLLSYVFVSNSSFHQMSLFKPLVWRVVCFVANRKGPEARHPKETWQAREEDSTRHRADYPYVNAVNAVTMLLSVVLECMHHLSFLFYILCESNDCETERVYDSVITNILSQIIGNFHSHILLFSPCSSFSYSRSWAQVGSCRGWCLLITSFYALHTCCAHITTHCRPYFFHSSALALQTHLHYHELLCVSWWV